MSDTNEAQREPTAAELEEVAAIQPLLASDAGAVLPGVDPPDDAELEEARRVLASLPDA